MIGRNELIELVSEFGLDVNIIEKDYVLGWILAGISQQNLLSQNLIFKGGTCLKKCFFETFRFSEDLDYTVVNPEYLDSTLLKQNFITLAEWIYNEAGIEIFHDGIRFSRYENPRGNISVEGKIPYRGPLKRQGDLTRIKLDLTHDEILVLPPVVRKVNHTYSDLPSGGIDARCYAFEELFAEKIRALAERKRPRDLYDVIHLYRHHNLFQNPSLIMSALEKKCSFKGIAVPTMDLFVNAIEESDLKVEWSNMLAHQLPVLPFFDSFWEELPKLLAWLHGTNRSPTLPSIFSNELVNLDWKPPEMAQAWRNGVPLEMIRFAATNRLCVSFQYLGDTQVVEPYALRKSLNGMLILGATKIGSKELQTYPVLDIKKVKVELLHFVPQFKIEMTP